MKIIVAILILVLSGCSHKADSLDNREHIFVSVADCGGTFRSRSDCGDYHLEEFAVVEKNGDVWTIEDISNPDGGKMLMNSSTANWKPKLRGGIFLCPYHSTLKK